jgi:hypothetical protein
MTFKLNKISAAIAGALAVGFVGQAAALTPDKYNSTSGDTLDLSISGASAQDGGIKGIMRRICVNGTLDIYVDSTTNTTQSLYLCELNKTAPYGILPGTTIPALVTKIAVRKTAVGGSGNGVAPVANATSLAFINPLLLKNGATLASTPTTTSSTLAAAWDTTLATDAAQGGCGIAAEGTSLADTLGLQGYTLRACTNYNVTDSNGATVALSYQASTVTEMGFSDVEPLLIPGVTTAINGLLTKKNVNDLVFSIIATKGLRDALQTAQGLSVGGDDEGNMPSLTTDQVRGLLTGFTSWGQIVSEPSGTNPGTKLTTDAGSGNDLVWIARRGATSGTQVFTQVHFLNQGCQSGVTTFLPINDTAATNVQGDSCGSDSTARVWAGSAGADVRACMNRHDANSHWAIGILTTEDVMPSGTLSGTQGGWRTLKLDGFAPTLLNVFNGRYKYWSEQSVQYKAGTTGLTGAKKTLADGIIAKFADGAVVDNLNSGMAQPWGQGGILALSSGAVAPLDPSVVVVDAAAIKATPVNSRTRKPGALLNNCQPAVPTARTTNFK